MGERYWLSRECFVCRVDPYVVCFDTRKNTYRFLHDARYSVVSDQVHGWPRAENGCASLIHGSTREQVLEALLSQRLVVGDPKHGKAASPVVVAPPVTALLDEHERLEVHFNLRELAHFMRAAVIATLISVRSSRARYRYLENRARITAKRLRQYPATASDIFGMRRALSIFLHLRPLLYKSKDQFWIERLVLLKFLEYQGYYATWVFGVTVEPFKSHSWLQADGIVIDEALGVVSSFRPIMAF